MNSEISNSPGGDSLQVAAFAFARSAKGANPNGSPGDGKKVRTFSQKNRSFFFYKISCLYMFMGLFICVALVFINLFSIHICNYVQFS